MIIPLTQGRSAIVDDGMEWLLAYGPWQWHPSSTGRGSGYAVTFVSLSRKEPGEKRRQIRVLMHDIILRPRAGYEGDHRNGDGLDNRRSNLREATRQQQCRNRRTTAKSGYKGVSSKSYRFIGERWHAHIQVDGKQIHIGTFKSPENAALAYNLVADQHFGEFARFNTPRIAS